jgi:fibronectin type 3 domain-containing protein
MKLTHAILLVLMFSLISFAEKLPDLVGFSDGKATYVFLPHAIPGDQGVVLWKKLPGGSWQKALPAVIRPIDDPYRMQKLLGSDYATVARTMKDPDPTRILTKLREDPVYSLMLCFKVPKLSLLLGRLIVDTKVTKGQRVAYRVEFVDKGNNHLRYTSTIYVNIAMPRVREVRKLHVKVADRLATVTFTYPKFDWKKADWVVGFRLYRSEDGINFHRVGSDFIFRLDNPKVTLQDGLLEYGKTYWYKVTTVSYFGYESKGSTPVKVYVADREPPSIVQNVQAKFTGEGILINWDLSPEPDVVGYDVYRGVSAETVKHKLNTALVPAVQTYFLDSTGTEGEKYFYGVIAVDKAGNRSQMSARPYAIWEDNTPPPPPQWVKAVYGHGKLNVSWAPVTKEKVRGYYVYRGMDKEHLLQVTPKPVGKKSLRFADAGNGEKKFQFGESYWVAVRAVDMSWNLSDYAFTKIVIPDTIPPQPSTGVMVDIRKNGDVYFNWNPSPSPDVTAYLISLRAAGQTKPLVTRKTGTDTLRGVFHRLQKGQTYYLRIVSVDRAGNRSLRALEKKIEVRDYVPPPHPRNVFVRKTAKGYALSWNKVIDFDFVGYRIYRAKSPAGTYQPVVKTLIKGESYLLPLSTPAGYYQVRAVDSSGNESKKNEVVFIGR